MGKIDETNSQGAYTQWLDINFLKSKFKKKQTKTIGEHGEESTSIWSMFKWW